MGQLAPAARRPLLLMLALLVAAAAQLVSTGRAADHPAPREQNAQGAGDLDPGFAPDIFKAGAVNALALQPDGKLVIAGTFTSVRGVARNRVARLNPDGTLDTSFGNGLAGADNAVRAVALQPDGKVVIGGDFSTVNGVARNDFARLNADGSLDTAFGDPQQSGVNNVILSMAVQPDGRVLVGGEFTTLNGASRVRVARLNADGSLDTSFGNGQSGFNFTVFALAAQPDGRVLVGGDFSLVNGTSRGSVARLNGDGTLDATFGNGLAGAGGFVGALALQADGKVLIGGGFVTVNGTLRPRVARLNPDGTLDTSFSTDINSRVLALAVQPDGKVLVGGDFTFVNGTTRRNFVRLNANGTTDTGYGSGLAGVDGFVNVLLVQPDGKALVGGEFVTVNGATRPRLARLNTDGTLDTSFGDTRTGVGADINALALQPDGKIYVGGFFDIVNGAARSRLARLNGDGTLDASFAGPNVQLTGIALIGPSVNSLAVQPDGKLLVGGLFNLVNGMLPRRAPIRLNADGTLDTAFANVPSSGANGTVRVLAVQPDGKILIGGQFTEINGAARNGIARLNADGTLDTSFGGGQSGASDVNALALQPDGKIVIGGFFLSVNGTARNRVARLNADGTLDTAFGNGLAGANDGVHAVAALADGKILVGGEFNTVNGTTRSGVARLNADGTLDTTFGGGFITNGSFFAGVFALAVQPDGKIVIGGDFTVVSSTTRNRLARLNADGTLDTSFGSGLAGADDEVSELVLQPDGKILAGGEFTTVNGVVRPALARLDAQGPASPLVHLSATSYTGSEAARLALVTVTRSGPTDAEASVGYATADGSATERKDYSAAVGRLRFAPGEASKTVTIVITDDRFDDNGESFQFALSNPSGAALGSPTAATVSVVDDDAADGPSPVKDASFNAEFFVRQHYADFLGRTPDPAGLNFWVGQTTGCGAADPLVCRINVSAAFFLSIEYQETGYLTHRAYKAAYGDLPGKPVPLTLSEYLAGSRRIGEGVQVGVGDWQQRLEANKVAFFDEFVATPRFASLYAGLTNAQYVDALNANVSGALSAAERAALITALSAGGVTRAAALRAAAEDADFAGDGQPEKNRAFVLAQYFGYLRRNPDDADFRGVPDPNFDGYNFWLEKLNQFGGDFIRAEMVRAFIESIEYGERFGR